MRFRDVVDLAPTAATTVAQAQQPSETRPFAYEKRTCRASLSLREINVAMAKWRMRANAPALLAEKSRYTTCRLVRRPSWSRPLWRSLHLAAVWVHRTRARQASCRNRGTSPTRPTPLHGGEA